MKNKYWISGGVIAVVIILIVWFLSNKGSSPAHEENTQMQTTNSATSTDQTATSSPTPEPANKSGAASSAYTQALATYTQNGRRIQFTECHATPGLLVVKKGLKYMLDNRDKSAHTLKVGSLTYKIAGYGYLIVTAQNLGVNNIFCDGNGAGQINIEN